MPDPRHTLGRLAEDATATWLADRGWHILARRWRSLSGELDIVCLDHDRVLVGVEVKLRRTGRAGTAEESLDRRRVARLRRALADYATRSQLRSRGLRIDLVSATPADGAWRLTRLANVER